MKGSELISARMRILVDLALRDYRAQYQGTYLGFVWMYLQPLLFIGVLYLIFSLGFRAQRTVTMPFGLYLVCGMICWQYFSTNLASMSNVVRSHAFLVKKVNFDLSLLPTVKLVSSLPAHLFLVTFAVVLAWHNGYHPSVSMFQLIYYLVCMLALLTGLGWMTSSASVFVKDVGNVVTVCTQFGFWLTPIFWNVEMIPDAYRWLVKLNPAYYLVSGYRDSIILGTPFWAHGQETAYYWSVSLTVLIVGFAMFRRLRPHFAEVM
jgi:lipopolysaccharide transport system permease protein/teichoic acid transport system permease protein